MNTNAPEPEPLRAFARLAFSDAVKATQQRYGTREPTAHLAAREPAHDTLSAVALDMVAACDSFTIATSSRDGWPHAQHRGGPKGFLRAIEDGRALVFEDLDGNGQFITLGNLRENDRVCLLLIRHATAQRMKIWGHARVIDTLHESDADAPARRWVRIDVAAWDMNCRKHIRRRYDEEELAALGIALPG